MAVSAKKGEFAGEISGDISKVGEIQKSSALATKIQTSFSR